MPPPRASAFRPDQLWRSAREPMFWLDSDLRIIWVNHAWEGLTGHKAESILGTVCSSYGPSQAGDAADLAASFAPPSEVLAGRAATSSTLILSASGERLWRGIAFWPFRGPDGALLGLLGQVREADDPSAVVASPSHRLRVRLLELRQALYERFGFDTLIGAGLAHHRLLEQVRVASSSLAPTLIVGEPGTGKRHVARVIHQLGAAPGSPLSTFDCQALPADVLERELFAAAEAAAPSRLAVDDGSTLLVGDVLALPRDVQLRLVEALDGRVRLLCFTSGDPEAAVRSERLRSEFYYAASVLTIRLLPLRERRGEILLLAQHFLERANQRGGPQRSGFTPAAESALSAYDWPGNLRELARVVDHAHASGADANVHRVPAVPIDADDLPAGIRGDLGAAYLPPRSAPPKPLDEILTDVERRLIENAMAKARRNKSRAAEILGVSRPRLYRRIKELNLPDEPEQEA
ncbi:MAG: sigma 54-interacting transcriptional regulator [Paludisphaera borealis]|uniref:sigma 54-interacting transcriptional regulator n=1 Tax=Paludisphaera borealis TaxID=1387353 RepID=UPI00284E4998|nr:sigma 54-interacting transcriptional regulator [Paludisphaera borealis]MDR3618520.1 sigma 54-interacting transcriptional regulator [Paludisphaera borealis]